MLEHVYRRTAACTLLDDVVIATCDREIASVAEGFGATVAITSPRHERASDRVAEAVANETADIIVMVQGDEPLIRPSMIAAAVAPMLEDASLACSNLAAPIASEEELRDRNTIKVVTDSTGLALYFSRAPIPAPHARPFTAGAWLKQVCVIPFRPDTLQRFTSLPQGPLERVESIDMLRLIENRIGVRVVRTNIVTHAVDTPADVEIVESLLAADPWHEADERDS